MNETVETITAVQALGVALSIPAGTMTMGECQDAAPAMLEHLQAMGFDIVQRDMARALAESEERAELGDAWAAAEAALPEGFSFYGGASIEGYLFRAVRGSAPTESELRYSPTYNGSGPTPAAALRALAAALSEPETPRLTSTDQLEAEQAGKPIPFVALSEPETPR